MKGSAIPCAGSAGRLWSWSVKFALDSRLSHGLTPPTKYRLLEQSRYTIASYGYCLRFDGLRMIPERPPGPSGHGSFALLLPHFSMSLKSFSQTYARFESELPSIHVNPEHWRWFRRIGPRLENQDAAQEVNPICNSTPLEQTDHIKFHHINTKAQDKMTDNIADDCIWKKLRATERLRSQNRMAMLKVR